MRTVTLVKLGVIRENVLRVRQACGVDVIAVLKADAYGVGAVAVADAIVDLVHSWYVFRPIEAVETRLWDVTGKPTLAAVCREEDDPRMLTANGIRPAVFDEAGAIRYRHIRPVLAIDTGMQRFATPAPLVDELLRITSADEAFTHATRLEHVRKLRDAVGGRSLRLHAAATSLLHEPEARLDAVRPGYAMYAGAVTVTTPLVDARDSIGPVGYSGFESTRHGVILLGYSDGLRKGPCVVNGRPQRIIEVGMQSAYVTLDRADRAGDPVTLLGDGVTPEAVAQAWNTSPQEALYRLASLGERKYGD